MQTRRTVNGFGLTLRIAITVAVTGCLIWVSPVYGLWSVPAWIGLAVALLEWTERLPDRWSLSPHSGVSRLAKFMVDSRERANASIAGMLEGLIGPVALIAPIAGPLAVPMPTPLRITLCALVIAYVASAAVQVVNDASLYNYRDKPKMSRPMALLRALDPIGNAAVVLAILLSTDRDYLSVEQAMVLSSILLLLYPLMGVSDAAHLGSTYAYASSLQDTLNFVRAAYASDIHRLKSAIRARALFTGSETKAALQDVFLQTELIRQLAIDGRTVAAINDAAAAVGAVVRERAPHAHVEYSIDTRAGATTIDPGGLELLERLMLDSVDNAIKAGAPTVRVAIGGKALPHDTFERDIAIVDDGPGYIVPDEFPFGSSLRRLQRQCEAMGGRFLVSSAPTDTRVRAQYLVPRIANT